MAVWYAGMHCFLLIQFIDTRLSEVADQETAGRSSERN
jgi:hypothetical protein